MTVPNTHDRPGPTIETDPNENDKLEDDNEEAAKQHFAFIKQKTEAHLLLGKREGHAIGLASLENRIASWPTSWGDDLHVLIYGDFPAPPSQLDFPELGITIEPENVPDSLIRSASYVLKARVKVEGKTIDSLNDASMRINTLLSVLAVMNWGNSSVEWWSHITHSTIGGCLEDLDADRAKQVILSLQKLSTKVAQKVRSAMYWIREPRRQTMELYRSDVLRVYAGHWNAFECLVEAICLLHPQPKMTSVEKQAQIDLFIAARKGRLDPNAILDCYQNIVNPGFVGRASHALKVCFGEEKAGQYILECFRMQPTEDRLYNIRNAINHGDVDANDLGELLRVEDRQGRLWMIVFGMLGFILPIPRPIDSRSSI